MGGGQKIMHTISKKLQRVPLKFVLQTSPCNIGLQGKTTQKYKNSRNLYDSVLTDKTSFATKHKKP